MKKQLLLSLFAILVSNYSYACQEVSTSYDQITLNAKAVYVGGVRSIAVPDLKEEHIYADLNYPNETKKNTMLVSLNVYQTLNGQEQDKLDVTLDSCNSKDVKLGKMAILYQLDDGWHLKHDEFAITEAMAILSNEANRKIYNIAAQ